MATIPHSAPTRPQRRRKPDRARVLQSYQHQVDTHGKRGAYRRTGDLYGISDETVRRYVAEAEAPVAVDELPADLAYVPPPGGFPEPEPVTTVDVSSHVLPQAAPQTTPAVCGVITSSTSSNMAEMPQSEDATRHTPERATVAIAEDETPQPEGDPTEDYEPLGPETIEQPPFYDDAPSPGPAEPRPFDPEIERIITPTRTVRAPANMPKTAASYRSEPMVVTRVVRVPVERRGGAVAWLQAHEALSKQLLGLLVLLCLIIATWLG